jgi:CRISPR-associated protein Cas5d
MGYGFKVIAEGPYACFTRPEMKVERVSYDVPTPGALEGMLKSVYWKPSIRYVIDQVVVFNPIDFINIRRNEVQEKVLLSAVRSQMKGDPDADPRIYADESRSQRASMLLRNVRYGISFHFEPTGLKDDESDEKKHYNILLRRLREGQHYRQPCLGCSEFPVTCLTLVDTIDPNEVCAEIRNAEDVDLGFMLYRMRFEDGGVPVNGDWESPQFSDKAAAEYYRPHMKRGVIDVCKYRGDAKC